MNDELRIFACNSNRRVSDTRVKQGKVVGEVRDRDVVIFEDEVSTGGTLISRSGPARRRCDKRVAAGGRE